MTLRELREALKDDDRSPRFRVLHAETNNTLTTFQNRCHNGKLQLDSRHDDDIVIDFTIHNKSYVTVKVLPHVFDRNKWQWNY